MRPGVRGPLWPLPWGALAWAVGFVGAVGSRDPAPGEWGCGRAGVAATHVQCAHGPGPGDVGDRAGLGQSGGREGRGVTFTRALGVCLGVIRGAPAWGCSYHPHFPAGETESGAHRAQTASGWGVRLGTSGGAGWLDLKLKLTSVIFPPDGGGECEPGA